MKLMLLSKPASDAPHEHCQTVLCFNGGLVEGKEYTSIQLGEWVVWTYNPQNKGFTGGDYASTLEQALGHFRRRGAQRRSKTEQLIASELCNQLSGEVSEWMKDAALRV